jgi:beta-phosphoglucomutase-like phosphatase (HAD superfamily)
MKYQGIIFDFNGVLLWDGHLQERAWGRFSTEKRGVPFSQKEMAIHVHGRNNQHTLQYLMGQALEEEELHQLTQQKEAIYRQLCLDQGEDFSLKEGGHHHEIPIPGLFRVARLTHHVGNYDLWSRRLGV